MATVNLTVATAQKAAAPGSVAGGFRFDIDGVTVDSVTPVAVFNGVPAGNHVATCVAIDARGVALQPVADFTFSQAFNVPEETVMLDAPIGMTINVVVGPTVAVSQVALGV